jgi:hypothetical protein
MVYRPARRQPGAFVFAHRIIVRPTLVAAANFLITSAPRRKQPPQPPPPRVAEEMMLHLGGSIGYWQVRVRVGRSIS